MTSDKTFQEATKTDFKLVEAEASESVESVESGLNKLESEGLAPEAPPVAFETQAISLGFLVKNEAISLEFPVKTEAISLGFSGHPVNFPDDTFWERRGRQIFNFFYLGLAALSLYLVANTSDFLLWPAMVVLALLGLLILQAGFYAVFHQKMVGSSNVLAPRTQRNLRRIGIYVPLLAIMVACSNLAGVGVETVWHAQHRPDVLAGASLPAPDPGHIQLSSMVSPLNTFLAARLYDEAKEGQLYDQQLAMADRMVFFKPFDNRWKIRRLSALAFMPARQDEFNKLSAEYKEKFGDDGFLWNTLADIAQEKQDWPLALQMAAEHVRIHSNESLAYEQRSEIERQMGMTDAAETDAAVAKNLDSLK